MSTRITRTFSRMVATAVAALAACACALPAGAQEAAATQTSASQGVTVKVTPQAIGTDAGPWLFSVVLDTHSTDLQDDVASAVVLVTDDGRELKPAAWRGAAPGGHHREGILEFAAPTPRPSSVELRMQRPGESEVRSFRWKF